MNRLNNKNIYYIITGAPKARLASQIIKEMIAEGASVFTIPTKASLDFVNLNELEAIKGNIIKTNWGERIKLPKEDAVLIAPCTFNTLNSIAAGIANSYPLCLIASALGKNIPVFIAPAMNKNLWDHPITKENIKKLEGWNCRIIWPQISSRKVTMMHINRILDTLYFSITRINFYNHRNTDKSLYSKLLFYRRKYLEDFKNFGNFLVANNLNLPTAGCLSLKVPEGFLITSSGSEMAELLKEDVSLVTTWDEKNNRIEWVGDKAPSSETPLHCVIQKQKLKKMVLHFHCPKLTYSPNLDSYRSGRYCRYGTFKIGYDSLAKVIKNNFYIMKYHGELVIADTTTDLKKIIMKYVHLA